MEELEKYLIPPFLRGGRVNYNVALFCNALRGFYLSYMSVPLAGEGDEG